MMRLTTITHAIAAPLTGTSAPLSLLSLLKVSARRRGQRAGGCPFQGGPPEEAAVSERQQAGAQVVHPEEDGDEAGAARQEDLQHARFHLGAPAGVDQRVGVEREGDARHDEEEERRHGEAEGGIDRGPDGASSRHPRRNRAAPGRRRSR